MIRPLASLLLSILLSVSFAFAQEKHALVIGNAKYTGMAPLRNPENDARDMKAALESLGFGVDLVMNGSRGDMDRAVRRLQERLAASKGSYGFFFYAGHGVQADGRNYLLPVQADEIRDAIDLRDRALSLNTVLDRLGEAGNAFNMVVLDACRDNPFPWNRSGTRGLSLVGRNPAGSIVLYATGPNAVAEDGTGRNSPFTGHLLRNLRTEGLSVQEVVNRTGRGVREETGGKQSPQTFDQYHGGEVTYLGARPEPGEAPKTTIPAQPVVTAPAPTPVKPDADAAKKAYDSAMTFKDRNDYDTAISALDDAISLDPGNALYWRWRADIYAIKQDYDSAIADYTQAIKINPNFAYYYINRAIAHLEMENFDAVIADCTQTIKLEPIFASIAYRARGMAHHGKRSYDAAIADYTRAIQLKPKVPEYWNDRGDSHKALGNTTAAEKDYAEAERLKEGK